MFIGALGLNSNRLPTLLNVPSSKEVTHVNHSRRDGPDGRIGWSCDGYCRDRATELPGNLGVGGSGMHGHFRLPGRLVLSDRFADGVISKVFSR